MSEWVDRYFQFRFALDFILPAVVLVIIVLLFAVFGFDRWRRTRKMHKLGYTYDEGLSNHAVYALQPHWVKGDIRIHYRTIERLSYKEIEPFVKQKEEA